MLTELCAIAIGLLEVITHDLVVLDRLNPAERIAFVLHDLFDVPFDEIARVTGRSSEAARQLASRARRRVRGVTTLPETQLAEQRSLVERFLAALRLGDASKLVEVLDPAFTVHADATAAREWSLSRGPLLADRVARLLART